MPLGGIAIFAFPLAGTFYPEPAWPSSILAYIAVGWLAVGTGIVAWLARRRPDKLAATGQVFVDN
jgi:hypothetical protein